MPYPRMHETFHSWFSLHVFVNFTEKEPSAKFYGCFWPFYINLWSYKALNDETMSRWMNINNMLIVAYMQTFGNFGWCHFVLR